MMVTLDVNRDLVGGKGGGEGKGGIKNRRKWRGVARTLIFEKKNILYFFNIFENNYYMVKRELPAEKDTIFYLYVT